MAYRGFSGDVSVRMPNDLIGDSPMICAGLHEYAEEELATLRASFRDITRWCMAIGSM
jgi:hypothetical protein